MFARILKAGMLVLAAVAALSFALPVSAADWRGGGRGFHSSRVFHGPFAGNRYGYHRGFDPGRRSQFADRGRFWRNRPDGGRYAYRYRDGFRNNGFANNGFGNNGFSNGGFVSNDSAWRYNRRNVGPNRLLRRSSSSDIITNRGSGVTVILSDRSDVDVISNNYAGSTDVYTADGGTYVTGFGYSDDGARRASNPRPRATIIDTARAGDPCSHENGVCVIRAR
jgi:hypothetical protein